MLCIALYSYTYDTYDTYDTYIHPKNKSEWLQFNRSNAYLYKSHSWRMHAAMIDEWCCWRPCVKHCEMHHPSVHACMHARIKMLRDACSSSDWQCWWCPNVNSWSLKSKVAKCTICPCMHACNKKKMLKEAWSSGIRWRWWCACINSEYGHQTLQNSPSVHARIMLLRDACILRSLSGTYVQNACTFLLPNYQII